MMIYEWNINLLSKESLCEQIENLSEGRLYLKNKDKWENQRINLRDKFYSGKLNTKDYSHKSRILIQNVLGDIDTVFISDNLPF